MAGYTRQSTYTDGDIIQASDSNNEFDQLLAAFNESTGHSHDGTSAEGPVIKLIGDAGITTPLNKVEVDTANNRVGVFVDVSSSAVEQIRIQDGAIVPVTDDDVDLGASGAEFKDLYIDGTANIDTLVVGTSTGVTSVDNDLSSVSASDDTLASAKAIKTYVDAQVTAQDLDFQADTGGALNIDLDSETLTFTGGTGIDTSGSGNAVTFAIDSTVATLTGTQTLTNKTLTSPVIGTISNTGTLTLPTSTDTLVGRATTDTLTNKTIDSASNTLTLDLSEGTLTGTTAEFNTALSDGSFTTLDGTETLTNKTIDSASNTLTLDLSEGTLTGTTAEFNTALSDGSFATLAGTETLTNKTINGPDNTLTNIANASLANSSVTVNGTSIALGSSATFDTDDIGEGSTNLYYTDGRADARITAATGVSVQAFDAGLTSIAGLTTSANQAIYTTGSDTYAVTSLTAFGRSLIDDADASTARTTLGLGTAAVADTGTSAGNVVVLDGTGKLPAVDGSQLTNINFTETDPSALAFSIALG